MKSLLSPYLTLALAATALSAFSQERMQRVEFTVGDDQREVLLYAPPTAKTAPTPVIFAWHGHGGNMKNAAISFHFHTLWPEAIVIYPQGLNTPGRLTDPKGLKPGWQGTPGAQNDRDLKLFDVMWKKLHELYQVDDKRIYSSGHSNGGGFTYLLWAMRGDKFTAMAPSAAAATQTKDLLTPKPVLHVAGESDPLVKYAWQSATIEKLKVMNKTGPGKPWELDKNCTIYPSETGTPVVTAIHPGNHNYPKEAPGVIIKFFKSQTK